MMTADSSERATALTEASYANLTLLMMTGNRPKMFGSMLDRYAETSPGLRIVVGDWGDAANQEQNLAAAKRHARTVHYIAYPPGTPWTERFASILEHCHTPLTVMAPDDDFLMAEGLLQCVEFLQAHPDYSACHGYYYEVQPGTDPGQYQLRFQAGFVGRGHESSDPTGRLISLFRWYTPLFYVVQRTDNLRKMRFPAEVSSGTIHEFFIGAVIVILGKVARLQVPYYIRNNMPTAQDPLGDLTTYVLQGWSKVATEYIPVREKLVAMLHEAYPEVDRNWHRLLDVAFLMSIRSMFNERQALQLLANAGDLPHEDVPVIASRGLESLQIDMALDRVFPALTPLMATGWPVY